MLLDQVPPNYSKNDFESVKSELVWKLENWNGGRLDRLQVMMMIMMTLTVMTLAVMMMTLRVMMIGGNRRNLDLCGFVLWIIYCFGIKIYPAPPPT